MHIKRIRDLREDNDLYQRQVAKQLGIDQSTYSNYESGRINVPLDMVIRLADLYKVNIDYLLGRTSISRMIPKKYQSFRLANTIHKINLPDEEEK